MTRPAITAMGIILVATISLVSCGGSSVTESPAQPSPGASPAGPLVVTRTGGIAGVNDVVEIAEDGTAQLTTRTGGTRPCSPSPTALQRLRSVDLVLVGSAPAKPRIPDGFTYEVRSAAGSATAGDGDEGIRAELVAAAAAVIASCVAGGSGSEAPYQ